MNRSTPERIDVYDTTLRDGTQGEGISLSAEDKLRVAKRLDALGIAFIEAGWPGSNPKDSEFFARARDRPWRTTLVAFGSTRRAETRVTGNIPRFLLCYQYMQIGRSVVSG